MDTIQGTGTSGDEAAAVVLRDVVVRYEGRPAVDHVDLMAWPRRVLGLIGHNGAGKTTLIRVLSTVCTPDSGSAVVAGVDTRLDPLTVRSRLGVVGQDTAVDESMSVRANLVLVARLLGFSRSDARDRAAELVTEFGLGAHTDVAVRHCSGGLRRRLDLAVALVGDPAVLLLDEPTTGLDPVSRDVLWEAVTRRTASGTAVVLTTQYLDEAERLADEIVVLDHGRVVETGTPAELKRRFGHRYAFVDLTGPADADRLAREVGERGMWVERPAADGNRLAIVLNDPADLGIVVRCMDACGVVPAALTTSEPTLDDVYRRVYEPSASTSGTGVSR